MLLVRRRRLQQLRSVRACIQIAEAWEASVLDTIAQIEAGVIPFRGRMGATAQAIDSDTRLASVRRELERLRAQQRRLRNCIGGPA